MHRVHDRKHHEGRKIRLIEFVRGVNRVIEENRMHACMRTLSIGVGLIAGVMPLRRLRANGLLE